MASTAALELLIKLDGANKAGQELDDLGKKGGGLGDVFKTGAMIAGGAILGLGAALIGATAAAADEEKGIARLNNTLKNAIPNWDGNTDAVEAYISKQEQLGFADDQLRDSLNFLVRQTGSLTEAQELQTTAMDLARSANIDLATATKAVGKVDQNSIAILKKLGIQVTENMTKEEALTAIRASSAGASEAYANTTAGAMERIQNTFSNVIETIGGAVLPLISGPLQAFADWFQSPEVQAGIQAIATLIGETLVGAFQFFQNAINTIMPIIQPFVDAITGFFSAVGSGGDVMAALGGYFNDLGAAIGNAWNIVAPALGTLLGNIVQWVIDNGPTILANLLTWATAFASWVWNDAIPLVLAELGKLLTSVWNWIVTNGPSILTQLLTWAQQFGSWVWDYAIPALLGALGGLIQTVWTWITDNGPTILSTLATWTTAFFNWVWTDVIPKLPGWLWNIVSAVWKFISDNGPTILTELGKWTTAFFKWVWDEVVVKLPGWLWGIAQAVWDFIVKNGPTILAELGKWTKAFWDWTVDVATNLPTHLAPIATSIWNWITGVDSGLKAKTHLLATRFGEMPEDAVKQLNQPTGLPAIVGAITKWVHDTTMAALKWLWDTGVNLVTGLWNGFVSAFAVAAVRMAQQVATLVVTLQRAMAIHSPSQVMADQVGRPLAEGIGVGFIEAWTGTAAAIGVTVSTLGTTVKDMFDRVATGWTGVAAAIGLTATNMTTKVLDEFDRLSTGWAGIAVGIGETATSLTQKILDESDRMATGWQGVATGIGVIAGNIETDIHALATAFAADMAAMTAAYNAMKARLESGVTVGTTTVYNGSGGVPAGAGSGGPMGGGTPGGTRGIMGSVGAGTVGRGNVGVPSINIGHITIVAGAGADGREFARDFVEGLEYELSISIATRMPEIRVAH